MERGSLAGPSPNCVSDPLTRASDEWDMGARDCGGARILGGSEAIVEPVQERSTCANQAAIRAGLQTARR
jgi:hypothetical protein